MKVADLRPAPTGVEPFRRDRAAHVPAKKGCYALTTLDGTILYVGLASLLRSRLEQHLDNPEKRVPTRDGRAALFHWIEAENIEAIERGWLNSHQALTGAWPVLNKAASPLSR